MQFPDALQGQETLKKKFITYRAWNLQGMPGAHSKFMGRESLGGPGVLLLMGSSEGA